MNQSTLMIENSRTYEFEDGEDVILERGDVLAERTPLGGVLTWVAESISRSGVELSRGATRVEVSHETVKSGFENGDLFVGEPETHDNLDIQTLEQ